MSDKEPSSENRSEAKMSLESSDSAPAAEKLGLRVVPLRDREQIASQLAASLTDAFSQVLLNAERRTLNQSDKVRATMLDDLERQRANIESLIGLFAERLRQQEDTLAVLKEQVAGASARLDRQAEGIRSLSETQEQNAQLFRQFLDVLERLNAAFAHH